MAHPEYLLSFATDADGSQLFIHADAAGLDHLISSLNRLRGKLDEGHSDHDHMMADAWGGWELTERRLGEDERAIHHVKIHAWTAEWVRRHRLRA